MYKNGQGVPQDYALAELWYHKAADQGDVGAQFNLGLLYKNGQGVPQDYSLAAQWYRKAADQGYANALNNLGVLYKEGQGVAQDYVAAYALYNISAAKDPSANNKAVGNRQALIEMMTSDQITKAQLLSRRMGEIGVITALDQYISSTKSKSSESKANSSKPNFKPTRAKASVLDFVTTDNCTTSNDVVIELEFFRKEDVTYHWGPFNLQYAGVPLHSKLNCSNGEMVCYGARTSDNKVSWGCGPDCKEVKNSACYKCEDTSVGINFTCKNIDS